MDSTLSTPANILVRAQELATAAASDTARVDARLAMNVDALDLMPAIRAVMNTDYAGRYVFGGKAWGARPFDSADLYVGNIDIPEARVETDRRVQPWAAGSAVFRGVVDILAAPNTSSTALVADNSVAAEATLADLDDGEERVVAAHVSVGAYANTAANTAAAAAGADACPVTGNLSAVFDEHPSALVDAAPVVPYFNVNSLKTAYTATLQVSADSRRVSSSIFSPDPFLKFSVGSPMEKVARFPGHANNRRPIPGRLSRGQHHGTRRSYKHRVRELPEPAQPHLSRACSFFRADFFRQAHRARRRRLRRSRNGREPPRRLGVCHCGSAQHQ